MEKNEKYQTRKEQMDLICSRILKDEIKEIEMTYMASIGVPPDIDDDGIVIEDDVLELSLIADMHFALPLDDSDFNEELHKFFKKVEVYEDCINKFNKNNTNGVWLDSAFEITVWKTDGGLDYTYDISEVIK